MDLSFICMEIMNDKWGLVPIYGLNTVWRARLSLLNSVRLNRLPSKLKHTDRSLYQAAQIRDESLPSYSIQLLNLFIGVKIKYNFS